MKEGFSHLKKFSIEPVADHITKQKKPQKLEKKKDFTTSFWEMTSQPDGHKGDMSVN